MDEKLAIEAIRQEKEGRRSPLLVMIRPSKKCNARCEICSFWKSREEELAFEKILEVIKEAKSLGAREIRITGGEPMLFPHFFKTLEEIKKAGIEASFITNGSMLNPENVEKLRMLKQVHFSINHPNPGTHNMQRGLPYAWEKTISAIRQLKSGKNSPKIIANYVLSNKNYRQLPEMFEAGKDLFDEMFF